MKRKLRPNVTSWPDTTARQMRHVSDTKNCVSAREMAAPQLRSRDTWGPPLRAETHGAHPITRARMSQSAKAGQLRRWDICHIILSEGPVKRNCGRMRQAGQIRQRGQRGNVSDTKLRFS